MVSAMTKLENKICQGHGPPMLPVTTALRWQEGGYVDMGMS